MVGNGSSWLSRARDPRVIPGITGINEMENFVPIACGMRNVKLADLVLLIEGFEIALRKLAVWLDGMSHRKWRETKQQLICWPELALLGCCLVSLHFV